MAASRGVAVAPQKPQVTAVGSLMQGEEGGETTPARQARSKRKREKQAAKKANVDEGRFEQAERTVTGMAAQRPLPTSFDPDQGTTIPETPTDAAQQWPKIEPLRIEGEDVVEAWAKLLEEE